MLIPIYPITENVHSFREQEGKDPTWVEAPKGSELLPVKSVGLLLFVPTPIVSFVRSGWNPRQVLAEAGKPGGRFKVIEAAQA